MGGRNRPCPSAVTWQEILHLPLAKNIREWQIFDYLMVILVVGKYDSIVNGIVEGLCGGLTRVVLVLNSLEQSLGSIILDIHMLNFFISLPPRRQRSGRTSERIAKNGIFCKIVLTTTLAAVPPQVVSKCGRHCEMGSERWFSRDLLIK